MRNIDINSFNKGSDSRDATFNKRWWLCDKVELPQAVAKVVGFLSEYDSKRQSQYQISARMYGNANLMGINGLSFSKIASVQNALKDRVSYNLAQSGVDTVVAKMAKNKPKPLFLTSGGDWKMKRKSQKLDKFIEGIFYENKAYKMGPQSLRDCGVFGDGVIHVYNNHGRCAWERVISSELYIDWVDAFYGKPTQMHRVKNIDRQVLIELFPKKAKEIENANSASADLVGTYQNVSDQIAVMESWHLPSGPDAKDGLHCINIPEANLFSEEWNKDYFPFAFMQWSSRLYGFWGQGAVEQIQNIQLEINKLLWVVQRSMHLSGTFKILMENGSKIVKEHFNNDIGAIIAYSGEPPQYVVPPIVPLEIYEHINTLKTLGFEQLGVSMLSAASQKPAGLDSGKALREFNDIESDRFMVIGQKYEDFFLDLAKLSIATVKEIMEETGENYEVTIPGKKFIDTIDWSEIDLEDDEYIMKAFPVSSLPNDPAGRLSTIQEYMQAGLLSPRQGRRLLDFPDLEQVEGLQNATEDYLHKVLEKIVDDGEYTSPEEDDDLQMAKELVLEYIAQGKLHNIPEDRMQMLRTFNTQIDFWNQKAAAAAAPPMGAAGATPQASPLAPPQSNMIPNVPGAA